MVESTKNNTVRLLYASKFDLVFRSTNNRPNNLVVYGSPLIPISGLDEIQDDSLILSTYNVQRHGSG